MDNTTIATQQLQRMKELVEQLNRASEAYYNGQGELMTDFEWDARFDELRQLEQQTATVLPDSPTHNVSHDDMAGKNLLHFHWQRPSSPQILRNGQKGSLYGYRGNLTD